MLETVPNISTQLSSHLESRIHNRTARVGIIGLGYVGLPLALLFGEQQFPVSGFDIDAHKIDLLSQGKSYICRIPATEIQLAHDRGFAVTSDYSQIAEMDAIIICVPTPINEHREPDLSYIVNTLESIAPYLQPGQLVVLESTTYPGTTDEVMVPILEKGNQQSLKVHHNGMKEEKVFYVAFSPEREDPGNNDVARRDIPKVVGGMSVQATRLACALYGSIFNHGACLGACNRGDDQAAGEHLPMREYRVGE